MHDYRFPKAERMTLKKDIERVFAEGKSIRKGVITLKYCWKEEVELGVSVLIVAPKRTHRLAVSRNRIKRRLRELFRLHKTPLINSAQEANKKLLLAVIYSGKVKLPFGVIEANYLEAIAAIK